MEAAHARRSDNRTKKRNLRKLMNVLNLDGRASVSSVSKADFLVAAADARSLKRCGPRVGRASQSRTSAPRAIISKVNRRPCVPATTENQGPGRYRGGNQILFIWSAPFYSTGDGTMTVEQPTAAQPGTATGRRVQPICIHRCGIKQSAGRAG